MKQRSITREQARRIAVAGALLGQPPLKSVHAAVTSLRKLQLDPTRVVARAEQLVLFSRLGPYDVAMLERELWVKRTMFEYWAFIVPAGDFGIHRETMRRYPPQRTARGRKTRAWLDANASFSRYVLSKLRREGPLPSREIENRTVVPWRNDGIWSNDKNGMLETLWALGKIATAGRDRGERIWDLAERRLPFDEKRWPESKIARQVLETTLRVRGIARATGFGYGFDGRPPGWERALKELVRDGIAEPVTVEGVRGTWYAHRDVLARTFEPRTTVLCPFDPLVNDRKRTEELFDFHYRIEIYVPKHLRKFGYYVLPILHGDKLIGRLDPQIDRDAKTLRVHSIHAEPGASAGDGRAVADAIESLAEWVDAKKIEVPRTLPKPWAQAVRSLG